MAFPQRSGADRGGPGGAGNLKINYRIRAKQVRVIDPGGEQAGVMLLVEAIKRAEESGLDLVEVSPLAVPPVCRIMDYGKFKYDTKKQAQESRRKQVVVDIKEVKLRPKTDDHDVEFKVRHIQEFLEDGNKVKVTIMFRGREITHAEIGRDILKDVAERVKAIGQVEQMPKIEGKNMFMTLSPLKKGGQQQARPATPGSAGAPSPTSTGAPPPNRMPLRGSGHGPEIEVKKSRPTGTSTSTGTSTTGAGPAPTAPAPATAKPASAEPPKK